MGPYEATIRAWLLADQDAPKKQRHTARRVWQRLVREQGASLAESTVRDAVRRIRAEIDQPATVATVPQVHEPGREGEVDFGEFFAVIAGVTMKLWLFSLRLSASGRACHRAFPTQAQEAFFAGHVHAFERLGGVPGRIRYDNLKPAVARVLLGRDRIESERFILLRSHYGFDSFYCHPGIEGAHEKGGVEGDIGWFRRNHLVPVPTAASIAELNEIIAAFEGGSHPSDRGAPGHHWRRVRRGGLGAVGVAERGLRRRPSRECARGREGPGVRAPVPLFGAGLVHRLTPRRGHRGQRDRGLGQGLGRRHPRTPGEAEPSHSVSTTTSRSWCASRGRSASVPLAQARAARTFGPVHDAYWAEARRQLGDAKGTRALIDALLLARTLPRDAVVAGMSAALALCTVAPEVVAIEARRAAGERLAEVTPLTSLAGDDRPAPDLAAYDDLLGERRVGR